MFCIKSENVTVPKPTAWLKQDNFKLNESDSHVFNGVNSNKQSIIQSMSSHDHINIPSCGNSTDDFSDADSGISSPVSASYSDSAESNDETMLLPFGVHETTALTSQASSNVTVFQTTGYDVISMHNYANPHSGEKCLSTEARQEKFAKKKVEVCNLIKSASVQLNYLDYMNSESTHFVYRAYKSLTNLSRLFLCLLWALFLQTECLCN